MGFFYKLEIKYKILELVVPGLTKQFLVNDIIFVLPESLGAVAKGREARVGLGSGAEEFENIFCFKNK
jgi:hypothetical protein